MQDRVPSPGQEGRVLITPEAGGEAFYAKIEMADNPTQQGTALNKQNLLRDQTELELFGNASDRTVDEAFWGIANKINLIMGDQALLNLTVQTSSGNGIPGVLVSGLYDQNGSIVQTNENGLASGYVSEGTVTLSISGYADIEDYSESFQAVKGETYNKTIVATVRDFLRVATTKNVRFSQNVQRLDVSLVGAGGGGGGGQMRVVSGNLQKYQGGGGGGGGGEIVTQESVSFVPNQNYEAIIGGGGIGGNGCTSGKTNATYGKMGGTTSFMGLHASGGFGGEKSTYSAVAQGGDSGGTGGGDGGNGSSNSSAGRAGSAGGATYSDFDATESCSGGGGGGGYYSEYYYGGSVVRRSGGSGGPGGGGAGGDYSKGSSEKNGKDATSPGGGGGGGGAYGYDSDTMGAQDLSGSGGKGANGAISLRMHLAST